jgi:hypothetical protein
MTKLVEYIFLHKIFSCILIKMTILSEATAVVYKYKKTPQPIIVSFEAKTLWTKLNNMSRIKQPIKGKMPS